MRAGVRIRRYLSVEIDPVCNRVARTNYGASSAMLDASALRFFADARELTVAKLRALDCWPVHLLMGSTPCQDLTGCNENVRSGAPRGLEGAQSRLLYDLAAFHSELRRNNGGVPLAFLAENVVPQKSDEVEMEACLGLPPLHSEAAVFEAARRSRLLFSNIRFAEARRREPLYSTPKRPALDTLAPAPNPVCPSRAPARLFARHPEGASRDQERSPAEHAQPGRGGSRREGGLYPLGNGRRAPRQRRHRARPHTAQPRAHPRPLRRALDGCAPPSRGRDGADARPAVL